MFTTYGIVSLASSSAFRASCSRGRLPAAWPQRAPLMELLSGFSRCCSRGPVVLSWNLEWKVEILNCSACFIGAALIEVGRSVGGTCLSAF